MSFSRFLTISTALALLPLAATAQSAAPATPAAAPSDARPVTRGELPGLIREALMSNPEMIKEAVQKLREKQEAEAKKKTAEAMVKYKDALFNDASSPSVGDAKTADVTFVEFFDYHCGYCKHILPDITKLMSEDKKVRFIFKEYPILSEDSVTAARAALAVNRIAPDKYFDYHTALMKNEGKFDEKALLDIAKKLKIDTAKLKTEMASPEITAILDKNREMGTELGISGTPSLVIVDTLVPGAVPLEDMKKMVANVRSGKKADEGTMYAPTPPAAAPTAPAAPKAN
jgi:protein-disulfide isomerase